MKPQAFVATAAAIAVALISLVTSIVLSHTTT